MAETNDLSKSRQIRNLLLILGSAVGLACSAMLFMLYSYGPAGTYLAKNVLLSPESAKALHFDDFNPKIGTNSHFVFDLIEFSYYDVTQKRIIRTEIDISTYALLYKLIGSDVSVVDGAKEAGTAFNDAAASLSFRVRSDDNYSQGSSKELFEADFVKDYYRILLRGQSTDKQWVYFKHTNILEQVLELFAQK